LAVLTLLFQPILTQRLTNELYQSEIHGNALFDGKPSLLKRTQNLQAHSIYGIFGHSPAATG
jgi:hypothetical protein